MPRNTVLTPSVRRNAAALSCTAAPSSSQWVKSTEIGNAPTSTDRPLTPMMLPSACTSQTRPAVAMKFSASSATWKPIRSAPNIPATTSSRHGNSENSWALGKGMCTKSPMRTSGRLARSISGTSSKW